MTRLEAIKLIIDNLSGKELIVHANGAISRESFFCEDRKRNFYLVGSMGLAASVALGLALSQPSQKIIVFDGDGNILMGLGNLTLIGSLKPNNLIHFILDNQVYGTTGNQPTISPNIPLAQIAKASGYINTMIIHTVDELIICLTTVLHHPGPHFIQIKLTQEVTTDCLRIPYTAKEIKTRFISTLT